jgi:inosose dehydratase
MTSDLLPSTLRLRPASAPGTWGVEVPGDPANPPWEVVLDGMRAAGFAGSELGPYGFFPTGADELRGALAARGLQMPGGFVMEPFHDPAQWERIEALGRKICGLLSAASASRLLLIEDLVPERSRTAGRVKAAPALPDAGWECLLACVESLARIAREHGLEATFHPHAGTYVEFPPEIERLLAATDPALVGLCIDTGQSVYAGIDPVELYRRHAARTNHVHLKDVRVDVLEDCRARELSFEESVAAGVFCRLGDGAVDFGAFADALAAGGYDGWGTFEQDRLPDREGEASRADAQASLDHLRRVGLVTDASEPSAVAG